MIDWYRQREPREQLVLALGTILAVVVIGWTFVWTPLRDGANELDDTVIELSRQVIDLRRAATLSAATAPGTVSRDAPSLFVLVDQTARPFGLTFTRTTPENNDAITVSFRDARFDRLIGWLIELRQGHGFAVVSASFSGTDGTGLVSGQVRLDRS